MNKIGEELPGLYVHVPFCRTKCPYCDFYSVTTPGLVEAWLQAARKEAHLYRESFPAFDTLYLGGGTPSLLSAGELTKLMSCLRAQFTFLSNTEITIEVNPDDVTGEKTALYRDLGINRISVGVQSFNEKELLYLRRRHTARQAETALDLIRSSGFRNVGIDLMYGLDTHHDSASSCSWDRTLRRAVAFQPEHLSCYQLTLEEDTPFGKMKAEGKLKPVGEERERALFLQTSQFLEEEGYLHYEISNFAKSPGFTSRHNSKYWRHVPYLGLGPSAHSFRDGARWWNPRSIEKYCRSLAQGNTPVAESEILTADQLRLEALYLGLRTKQGVSLETLGSSSRKDSVLKELRKSRLVTLHDGIVTPTMEGFLVADSLPLLFVD